MAPSKVNTGSIARDSLAQASQHQKFCAGEWPAVGYTGAMARRWWSVPLALAALAPFACAAGGGASDTQGNSSGQGANNGSSSASGLDPNSACAKATDEAKDIPVNMYIMFDKSGSMAGSIWSNTTSALQSFFIDPSSAGLRVALRFFPDDDCNTSCNNVQACATPKVPLGELTELSAPTDAHEQALLDAFVDVVPSGGTPMSLALDGALRWARSVVDKAPNEKAVVVFVTDGEPTDCNEDPSYLFGIAAKALNEQGIITFAVGLEGAKESVVNGIAHAGGSENGIFVGSSNAEQELLAALNGIRDAQVACEFQMPESNNGQPVNPAQINVLYTMGGTTEQIPIGQVPGADSCGPKAAWYYDTPSNPTKIILCPSTCNAVQQDTAAKIEILVGCSTIPA